MAALHTYPRLREAGLIEKYSTVRHALGLYNNVACTAVYSGFGPSTDLRTLIFYAIRSVIDQHPSLSAIPVDEDKSTAYYVRLPSIDLSRAITFLEASQALSTDSEQFDKLLEHQHNTNFKEEYGQLPFWRLLISLHSEPRKFTASFVYAHSLGDGLSGLAFHRTLRAALNTAANEMPSLKVQPSAFVTSPESPLLPNLEVLHTLPITLWFLLTMLWSEWFPPNLKLFWGGRAIRLDASQRKVCIRTLTIAADRVSDLLSASRVNNTSLTGTLEAILAAAIFASIPPEECQTLVANSPISLRRFLPRDSIQEDSIGVYVSSYTYTVQRDHAASSDNEHKSSFFSWDVARKVKQTIDEEVKKKCKNTPTGLLRYAGDLKAFFEKKDGRNRIASFECSNLGLFKDKAMDSGAFKIEKVVFSQDVSPTGAAIAASLVTGPDGCLSVAFSWLDDAVEVAVVERVISSFEKTVEELVS